MPFDGVNVRAFSPPPPTVADTLRKARARLTPPGAWTRGAFARDRTDDRVEYDDPRAVKWCALGAIYLACKQLNNVSRFKVEMELKRALPFFGPQSVQTWNDMCRTQKKLLKIFDRAIAAAERKGHYYHSFPSC